MTRTEAALAIVAAVLFSYSLLATLYGAAVKVQDSHGYTIDVEGYGKFLLDRATWEQITVGEIATQDILKRGELSWKNQN